MNIGILGTGFGAHHAGLLVKMKQVDKVVIFGRNETKLHKLKQTLGVEVTTCIEDIMLDPTIDVVDLCLPSNLHKQYAIEALKNGKHVFCETPVCLQLEDALAMKQAEEQYGKRVLVNQFIKFEPAYHYLYEAALQEKYGKLLSFTLKRETAPLWGDLGLGSITTNLMIHELDFVAWMLGSIEDCSVWGAKMGIDGQSLVRANFHNSEVYAETIVSSQMPETYPFTVGYEAYFERAKLIFHESEDMNGSELSLTEFTSSGKHQLVLEQAIYCEKSIEHALQCLEDNSSSILSLDHAVQALEIALELREKLLSSNGVLNK